MWAYTLRQGMSLDVVRDARKGSLRMGNDDDDITRHDAMVSMDEVTQDVAKPLTVISGYAQLLVRRIEQGQVTVPDEHLRALRAIEENARRLRQRLEDFGAHRHRRGG